MKIFLVIWSECDSGHEVLGAYRDIAEAMERSNRPTYRAHQYGAEKWLEDGDNSNWGPYTILDPADQDVEEVELI